MDQSGTIEVKMTMALIDINQRLVSNFFEMNHKGLRPIVVRVGLRYHRFHFVGKIFAFDITEMNNKSLRP